MDWSRCEEIEYDTQYENSRNIIQTGKDPPIQLSDGLSISLSWNVTVVDENGNVVITSKLETDSDRLPSCCPGSSLYSRNDNKMPSQSSAFFFRNNDRIIFNI